MLGSRYRLNFYNGTGGSVTITPKFRGKYFAGDDLRFDPPEGVDPLALAAVGAITNGNYGASAAIVNAGKTALQQEAHLEADFELSIVATGSPSGVVDVYYQTSIDGGTTWPADGAGLKIRSLSITAAATKVFQLTVNGRM